jgi:ectoine hydroxylase-related dioxygenase (phytanoyl-CoA dioxygenase family)
MSMTAAQLTVDATPLRDASADSWNRAIKATYEEHGIVLLRNLLPKETLAAVQSDLRTVIQLALEKVKGYAKLPGTTLKPGSGFDAGMLDICAADRAVGGEIFRVAKKFISVQRLTTSTVFENISKALMESENLAVHVSGTNVRADHPDEDHYLYPWHQDYLYNLGSQDSVTFWIPMIDVDDVNGCLMIAPGSQKEGVYPVQANDPLNTSKNSAKSFTIANLPKILDRFDLISVPMQAGDAVVFHGNLLHSSQANRSQATRWSLQFRYFNLSAPDAVKHGWPGGMAEDIDVVRMFPEFIASQ